MLQRVIQCITTVARTWSDERVESVYLAVYIVGLSYTYLFTLVVAPNNSTLGCGLVTPKRALPLSIVL